MIFEARLLERALKSLEEVVISGEFESTLDKVKLFPEIIREDVKLALEGLYYKGDHERKGKFLVVSGMDKTGKETLCFNPSNLKNVTSLKDYIKGKGYEILAISLPSYNTKLGSLVASYLGKESTLKIKGELSEHYAWILWSLDRAQHNLKVAKWLSKDKGFVLAKRWVESNVVYQKVKGIEVKRILSFERNIVKQDFTIILDASSELVIKRSEKLDKYESLDFLKEIRRTYLNLPTYYPFGEFFLVDSSRSLEEVNKDLLEILEKQIN
ncbi:MAG: hypothetical protein QXX95_08020 [Nitrososphaerales archaeon]